MSMAIARSVLEVVEEEKLQENAQTVGAFLLERLRQLAERHAAVGDVRGMGLCLGLEIVSDFQSREPAPDKARHILDKSALSLASKFFLLPCRLLREHKILAKVDDTTGNIIKVKPPLCFTKENAQEFVSALDAILILLA